MKRPSIKLRKGYVDFNGKTMNVLDIEIDGKLDIYMSYKSLGNGEAVYGLLEQPTGMHKIRFYLPEFLPPSVEVKDEQ